MMNLTTLPLSFWDYALESATHILNMVPTKKVDKTPYELWYRKVPNLSYLKVWGCEALVKRDTPDKLQQRSVKCIFIGYPKETMGYYFYFPPENKIVVARYAEFFEKSLTTQEVSGRAIYLEEIQDEDTSLSENTSKIPMEEHSLGDLNEPTSYKAAMLDPESNKWLDAMNAEMQSMIDNKVWVLVDLPPNCKIVGSKWIFKKETNIDGIIHTYKARLVTKGYTQLYGVDYEETFSPVDDNRAIRILISIATFYDYEIWQMDVKTAFLNGYLDEDIYMVQPEGFIDPKHLKKVCKLQRSIYGLKQASRSWNKRFDEK
ncbi:retrotransposon protein, putative, ty1-copia subclass, partial [Tanacetum coccineum]